MNLIEALLRFIRGGPVDLPEGYVPQPHQYKDMFCQLLDGTDYPCEKGSEWLVGIQNNRGGYQKIYVCEDHDPRTDSWTKRYFQIKKMAVLDIKPIWRTA